mgnify:CR=1 FL=1
MGVRVMDVSGSNVGIVGGSIAGCAAAIALDRLGCSVTVVERSSGALRDRGSGIAVPIPLRDELVATGYLPEGYASWLAAGRRWYAADGSATGRLCWNQPGSAATNNWGVLWRSLRERLPDSVDYVDGTEVDEIGIEPDHVGLGVRGGPDRDVDVVVGADGYRSRLRSLLHPESRPRIAGYVLWRGNFPADRLEDTAAWQEVLETREWLTVGFAGGHGVMYPIPDFDADGEERLRVNWAIYAPVPDGLTVTEPHSIPPGGVATDWYEQYAALVEAHIPPRLRPVFTSPADEVSIQPIYDELVDTYVGARSLLIGDAATLSRPHTGSGATKALQDARLLETLGATATSWADLLGQYDADRTAVGRSLVELGRRIGRDQVENTPPWGEMTSADYEAWAEGTLSGESLYFWGDQEPADAD